MNPKIKFHVALRNYFPARRASQKTLALSDCPFYHIPHTPSQSTERASSNRNGTTTWQKQQSVLSKFKETFDVPFDVSCPRQTQERADNGENMHKCERTHKTQTYMMAIASPYIMASSSGCMKLRCHVSKGVSHVNDLWIGRHRRVLQLIAVSLTWWESFPHSKAEKPKRSKERSLRFNL